MDAPTRNSAWHCLRPPQVTVPRTVCLTGTARGETEQPAVKKPCHVLPLCKVCLLRSGLSSTWVPPHSEGKISNLSSTHPGHQCSIHPLTAEPNDRRLRSAAAANTAPHHCCASFRTVSSSASSPSMGRMWFTKNHFPNSSQLLN